jgi:hypothetical protein
MDHPQFDNQPIDNDYNGYNDGYNDYNGSYGGDNFLFDSKAGYLLIGLVLYMSCFCLRSRAINNHDSDLDNTLNQPDDNQTLPKIISEIKKNTVHSDTIDKGLICSICLDDFNSEKEVIFLDCKHIYHMECIIEWINKDASCPLCRSNELV